MNRAGTRNSSTGNWSRLVASSTSYEVIDDIGITNPRTGEVWTNPTLDKLVELIIGDT